MNFWIVTPSRNQLAWLKRCVASVRDQASGTASRPIAVHHHVQDARSTDGTREWLEQYARTRRAGPAGAYTFSFDSANDDGMYDALNRGWTRAPEDVDVFAHLNCDEQYLPGGLAVVQRFFETHARTEVVMADMIVVDRNGDYICHRRSLKPRRLLSRLCCVGMTATTFHRAAVVQEKKVLFDPSWRNIGDMVWYNALLRAGVRHGVCNRLVALFVDTGENLNLTAEAVSERKRYAREYLWGLGRLPRLVSKVYSLGRCLKEIGRERPKDYAFFWDSPDQRTVRAIANPTPLWHRRGPAAR